MTSGTIISGLDHEDSCIHGNSSHIVEPDFLNQRIACQAAGRYRNSTGNGISPLPGMTVTATAATGMP